MSAIICGSRPAKKRDRSPRLCTPAYQPAHALRLSHGNQRSYAIVSTRAHTYNVFKAAKPPTFRLKPYARICAYPTAAFRCANNSRLWIAVNDMRGIDTTHLASSRRFVSSLIVSARNRAFTCARPSRAIALTMIEAREPCRALN